jgi:hypothetical protein
MKNGKRRWKEEGRKGKTRKKRIPMEMEGRLVPHSSGLKGRSSERRRPQRPRDSFPCPQSGCRYRLDGVCLTATVFGAGRINLC